MLRQLAPAHCLPRYGSTCALPYDPVSMKCQSSPRYKHSLQRSLRYAYQLLSRIAITPTAGSSEVLAIAILSSRDPSEATQLGSTLLIFPEAVKKNASFIWCLELQRSSISGSYNDMTSMGESREKSSVS